MKADQITQYQYQPSFKVKKLYTILQWGFGYQTIPVLK